MDPLKFLRTWKSESGAELVEFALSFPLLLLVTLGIIDFGLLFQRYEVLTNASREGARVAVLPGYDDPGVITARVNQYLQGTSLTPATVTTTIQNPPPIPIGGGNCITVRGVTVTYTHQFMFVGGIMSYFGSSLGTKTLTAATSMRREGAATSC